MKNIQLPFLLALLFVCLSVSSQVLTGDDLGELDYGDPRNYEIGGITISGIQYLDHNALITLTGLVIGDKIKVPGESITKAVKKLWDQGLFQNVIISITRIQGDKIFLNIHLIERPRLSKFTFTGLRKGEIDKIRDEIKIQKGDIVTENLIVHTSNTIRKYFVDKGFLDVESDIVQKKDTSLDNRVILYINVIKHHKVKIDKISIHGNAVLEDYAIKRTLKETRERSIIKPFHVLDTFVINAPRYLSRLDFRGYAANVRTAVLAYIKPNFFKSSRLIQDDYDNDKVALIGKYNELGYRDANIMKDSIYRSKRTGGLNIDLYIEEGRKYYYRNIVWVGNTKYSSSYLDNVLRIKKGDVYNQKVLDANLMTSQEGLDVSSLYLDDGYLFFTVDPVEVKVEHDSIDLEIRIREGKQARINKITLKGNSKTSDHVIMRELRTRPGQLFSRSDIIRSVRELAQLNYFDPEKLNPVPKPNPVDGTVDIEYELEEKSSDQVELSGGWGYGKVVGTLGVSFSNFSLRKILKPDAWRPVPGGDGQKLSIRMQSYGKGFFSYNFSFVEPWLGGKKPNALSVSYFHSQYSNGLAKSDTSRWAFITNGVVVSFSKRLKWPDDYFAISHSFSWQRYDLDNYSSSYIFSDGFSHNLSYGLSLSRNSIDQPIYPRSGSEIALTMQFTPPYSWFSVKNYETMENSEKYRWVEFHKYKFNMAIYTKLAGNFVLMSRAKYGFLATYNKELGITPFERFYLGGDGLYGYNSLDGREVVGMRGYANESLTPEYATNTEGGTIFSKLTMELRYPITLNPNSTIYMLGFFEAGNSWYKFRDFNPFNIKRSAGIGIRVFLPMFGVLGLDWGYGFDEIEGAPGVNRGQFHFSINQSID